MIVLGGEAVPAKRLFEALLDAEPLEMEDGQIVVAVGIALFRRHPAPAHRFFVALDDTVPRA